MDCSEFQSMLDSYAELDDIKRAEMDEHCVICEKCREELEFYKSVIDAVKTLPEMKAPKSLLVDINARIDNEEKKQKVFTCIGKNSYRYGAVAACVALLAIVGIKNSTLVDRLINKDYGVVMETSQTVMATEKPVSSQEAQPTQEITVAPTAVATAEPTKKTQKTVKPTPKPTTKPKKKTTEKAVVAPVITAVPTAVATAEPTKIPVTPVPTVEAVTITDAPAMETPAYTIQQRGYTLPDEGEETAYLENGGSEDYSISKASEEWAVVSTTLTVSPEDEERVRELIDIYTSAFDGASYTIDPERMEYMLDVFTQEGIEYNDSAMEATRDAYKSMMFTLIVA